METEAGIAYEQALEALRLGRSEEAQFRLESLIARFPASPFADGARAKVVDIYTAPLSASSRSSLGMPPETVAPGTAGSWQIEVRHATPLTDDFRAKVGDRVFFAPGSVELGARAAIALRAQATWLRQHAGLRVVIEGHADDTGSDLHNRTLAERRAEAVRRRLMEEGVAGDRLSVVSYGNERRVAQCAEAICGAQNRRAVCVLQETGVRAAVAARQGGIGRSQPDRGGVSR